MKRIDLGHGAGGLKMHGLIRDLLGPAFAGRAAAGADDAAVIETASGRLAFTTDGFVVRPMFFPGGDIGKLSVCGTVNDLAVAGAVPRWLSVSLVIEEGLERSVLEQVAASLGETAQTAGVEVVTGDTKVVGRGSADGLFITTSGVGELAPGVEISGRKVTPGLAVLVSGTVGDHEAAVLNAREGLVQSGELVSDCVALNCLVARLLEVSPSIVCMRDPTRGGLATTLNEIALQAGCTVELEESAIPVKPAVAGFCELLGLDPFYLACEGRVVVLAPPGEAPSLLAALRDHPQGRDGAVIGRTVTGPSQVVLETSLGGRRVLDMLSGRPLPRIC